MLVFALHARYSKCFYRITRVAFETRSTGKIVVMSQKLLNIAENLNLLVCLGYKV